MPVSLQFGNCAGSTSNSSLFEYLSMESSCNSSYLVHIDSHSWCFLIFIDKATLSSSAVSLSIQVKYSLSMLPSKLAFLFLEAILHLVKEMLCAWGDGKTTDKCHKLHPVISSTWTEGNFRTVPCEQNVRLKFSAGQKFVRHCVDVT